MIKSSKGISDGIEEDFADSHDDRKFINCSGIKFDDEVQQVLRQVLPSDDPLDDPNFSPVDYINQKFPNQQSLNNLEDVAAQIRYMKTCADDELREVVKNGGKKKDSSQGTHATLNESQELASSALLDAQSSITNLFTQIRQIKQNAIDSEAMVRDITRDIKQLDTAKRNLTSAITTLNQLHMFVGGVNTLSNLFASKNYREASMVIQGLREVQSHLTSNYFNKISTIRDLTIKMRQMQVDVGERILKDFKHMLEHNNVANESNNVSNESELRDACLLLQVIECKDFKSPLMSLVVDNQLAEYVDIYNPKEVENASLQWLDRVDGRYNWLKRRLIQYENGVIAAIIPEDWQMSERIAVQFCHLTRQHLDRVMGKRKQEIDNALLVHAIQKTVAFESLMNRRFAGITLLHGGLSQDESNPFADDMKEEEGETSSSSISFTGIINKCFTPYMYIFVESKGNNLSDLVDRAASEINSRGYTNMAKQGSAVLHTCGDLFMFYKKCLVQCGQMMQEGEQAAQILRSLAAVFKKYLRAYANRVLLSNMPSIGKTMSSSATSAMLSSSVAMKDSLSKVVATPKEAMKDFSTTGLLQNFQSLLKDTTTSSDASSVGSSLSDDAIVQICTLLITSEYCLETTEQLELKLNDKISTCFSSSKSLESGKESSTKNCISFAPEQDLFSSVIDGAINTLVTHLDMSCCDQNFTAMLKVPWSTLEVVGDQSSYISSIAVHLKSTIPLIRSNLSTSMKYFTQVCTKFSSLFIAKFCNRMFKCKPISTVGAEQLLLDAHSMKTILIDLPILGASTSGTNNLDGVGVSSSSSSSSLIAPPPAYAKMVMRGMTRAEMILKTIMLPLDSQFVNQYFKFVSSDSDSTTSLLSNNTHGNNTKDRRTKMFSVSDELSKILDMKDVKKSEQASYIEAFNEMVASSNRCASSTNEKDVSSTS